MLGHKKFCRSQGPYRHYAQQLSNCFRFGRIGELQLKKLGKFTISCKHAATIKWAPRAKEVAASTLEMALAAKMAVNGRFSWPVTAQTLLFFLGCRCSALTFLKNLSGCWGNIFSMTVVVVSVILWWNLWRTFGGLLSSVTGQRVMYALCVLVVLWTVRSVVV